MTKEGPMPFYSSCRGLPRRFRLILSSFMQRDDLAFAQALSKDHQRSCRAAVARVLVLLASLGKAACSDNTGAYCRARAKLPVPVIRRLTTDIADGCEQR